MELPPGTIWVGTVGSRVCICVKGRATHLHGPPLRDFAEEMMRRGYDRFELDLGHCTYMDSTILGILASLSSRLEKAGFSRWSIYRISQRLLELFTTLGIDRFFEMNSPGAMAGAPAQPSHLPPLSVGIADTAWAESVLASHRFLAEADERNELRFKDLLEYLKDDLARAQPSIPGSTEPPVRQWKQ